jgi:hypothetical protein
MSDEPKTVAEQLDAAQSGEEFGQVLQNLFKALEDEDPSVFKGFSKGGPW